MRTARVTGSRPGRVAELPLLSVLFGILAFGQPAKAQLRGTFVPTGDMTTARSQHRATLLADGRVLITGGYGENLQILSSAELYDPSTGTFARTGDMSAARRAHTATLLSDGKVLIAGGIDDRAYPYYLSSAELYDPATGTFIATGAMIEAQGIHTATLLGNGEVLIAGGGRAGTTAAFPELYDPAPGSFSLAGGYAGMGTAYGGPVGPTASLLPGGRVLIVAENPPEIYDPISRTFSFTGRMIESNYQYGVEMQAASSLRDGTVLITGGNDDNTCGGFNNAEIFDPSSGTFRVVRPMTISRDFHTSTLLHDGSVLLTGGGDGWCGTPTHDTAELYDPATRMFVDAGRMTRSRSTHTATLLNDGTVLIAGGVSYWPLNTARSAELYRPASALSGRRRGRR